VELYFHDSINHRDTTLPEPDMKLVLTAVTMKIKTDNEQVGAAVTLLYGGGSNSSIDFH
jgi:hypothetical protein